jgi:hypothetical protein
MNAPTIRMDPAEARRRLRDYTESQRRRVDAEHEALAQAYGALAEGTPLLSLQDAVRAGGFDEKMRPRLAIARADRRHLRFTWSPHSELATFDARVNSNGPPSGTLTHNVDLGRRHGVKNGQWQATVTAYALVPMIPADVRNRMRGQPREHFTLFEVEGWSDTPIRAEPNRDPYLLRRLSSDLFVVVDEWDLTPLELLVMRGRRET